MNIFTALFKKFTSPDLHEAPRKKVEIGNSVPDLIRSMRSYNGHHRQAAITRSVALGDPELLLHIAERLNDWVPQVRDAARSAVIRLLPLMPAQAILAILPTVEKLRAALRSDHLEWLGIFECDVIRCVSRDDLVAGVTGTNVQVARAGFDILQRMAGIEVSALILLGLRSRGDIVMALRAANMIHALPAAEQQALYLAAMASHFGAVRTVAIHALLCLRGMCELASSYLLSPQSTVRDAAIGYLRSEGVDVLSGYRARLETPGTSNSAIRICLASLASWGNCVDIALVKVFVANPTISIRAAAYSAWLRLAENDKDEIASMALGDEARTIRKYALDITRRRGAFIPFGRICRTLLEREDWSVLLGFAELEQWNLLEAIALIALATDSVHPMRAQLKLELAEWLEAARNHTRPTPAQIEYLLAAQTIAVLASMAPHGVDFPEFLRHELAVARGQRS